FHSLGATPVHSTHSVLLLKVAAEVTLLKVRCRRGYRCRRFAVVEGSPLSKSRRYRRLAAIEGFAALCRHRTVESSTSIVEDFENSSPLTGKEKQIWNPKTSCNDCLYVERAFGVLPS
ncbi:hypothetical protein VIGAN_06071600, partial [Vigna angularis var. angularis]